MFRDKLVCCEDLSLGVDEGDDGLVLMSKLGLCCTCRSVADWRSERKRKTELKTYSWVSVYRCSAFVTSIDKSTMNISKLYVDPSALILHTQLLKQTYRKPSSDHIPSPTPQRFKLIHDLPIFLVYHKKYKVENQRPCSAPEHKDSGLSQHSRMDISGKRRCDTYLLLLLRASLERFGAPCLPALNPP